MSDTLATLLPQVLSLSPLLFVYLLGAILAIVYRKRHPLPSLLALAATAILLLATVTQLFVTQYVIELRNEPGWNMQSASGLLAAVNLGGNLARAIAFGLILAAVFIRR